MSVAWNEDWERRTAMDEGDGCKEASARYTRVEYEQCLPCAMEWRKEDLESFTGHGLLLGEAALFALMIAHLRHLLT